MSGPRASGCRSRLHCRSRRARRPRRDPRRGCRRAQSRRMRRPARAERRQISPASSSDLLAHCPVYAAEPPADSKKKGSAGTPLKRSAAERRCAWGMPRSEVDPRPESAEGLEALVSDLIFWVDQELCILRSNATAQRLLRHEPDVLHGLAFEGLIAPPSRRTFATFVAERRAQGGPSTRPIEVRLQMHETPELPVEIALHASEFAGKPAWLIVARDLSDRRQLRARAQPHRVARGGELGAARGDAARRADDADQDASSSPTCRTRSAPR